jgi:hypothetical protein
MGIDSIKWRSEIFGKCRACGKTGYALYTVYDHYIDGKLEELTRCLNCRATNQFETVINDSADAHNFAPKRTYDDYYRRSSFGENFENRGKTGKSKR